MEVCILYKDREEISLIQLSKCSLLRLLGKSLHHPNKEDSFCPPLIIKLTNALLDSFIPSVYFSENFYFYFYFFHFRVIENKSKTLFFRMRLKRTFFKPVQMLKSCCLVFGFAGRGSRNVPDDFGLEATTDGP